MEQEFATHKIALKLKKLGFDEPCFGYYSPMKEWMMKGTKFNSERHFHGYNWSNADNTMYFRYVQNLFGDRNSVIKNSEFTEAIENIAVPLWQQVIDWLREKYNISLEIFTLSHHNSIQYCFNIKKLEDTTISVLHKGNVYYPSYHKAREQAILKAVESWKKY